MRGSIAKKGKKWYAVVYVGPDPLTGKDRRRWVMAGTRKGDAERLLAELIQRKYEGETVVNERVSSGSTWSIGGCRSRRPGFGPAPMTPTCATPDCTWSQRWVVGRSTSSPSRTSTVLRPAPHRGEQAQGQPSGVAAQVGPQHPRDVEQGPRRRCPKGPCAQRRGAGRRPLGRHRSLRDDQGVGRRSASDLGEAGPPALPRLPPVVAHRDASR